MARYVALLRGINVGGKNLIKMPALVEALTDAGFKEVSTYIQSGNVLFSASKGAAALEKQVEQVLAEAFDIPVVVVVKSRDEVAEVIAQAPKHFGDPAYRCDAIFLKRPWTPERAFKQLPALAPQVDFAEAGPGVLYFSRVDALASKSRLTRVIGTEVYQAMTIRNWNTTTKLLELLS